jgi:hypothetical protein
MPGNGGPAFPVPEIGFENQKHPASSAGMTLRDYFAAQALAALIEKPQTQPVANLHDVYARSAYVWADAMLKAREA